jgi:hypothetical protein
MYVAIGLLFTTNTTCRKEIYKKLIMRIFSKLIQCSCFDNSKNNHFYSPYKKKY